MKVQILGNNLQYQTVLNISEGEDLRIVVNGAQYNLRHSGEGKLSITTNQGRLVITPQAANHIILANTPR